MPGDPNPWTGTGNRAGPIAKLALKSRVLARPGKRESRASDVAVALDSRFRGNDIESMSGDTNSCSG